MAYKAKRNPDRCPSHPGLLIAEALENSGRPKAEIARMLGISRQQLYAILEGSRPVTANMAVRFGKLLGNGPALWLAMQAAYDIWHAEREVPVAAIPTLAA
ncbi:MAG: HigA family addiction module antitoxin [Beijerinckiaceae bacterium]